MTQAVISNGEHRFGGGLWSDLVSIHSQSRLPLFWSFHKNSFTDKYFECFNKHRLEEDFKYAQVAQLERHLTSACISNCGSFLFSGYSDGWLIKNFMENGQFSKKFKYNDSVKKFDKKEAVHQVFADKANAFLVLIKSDRFVKVDFFSGEILATTELKEIDAETDFTLDTCKIKCDQINNFIVCVSPSNKVLVLNWTNMAVVRYFSLKNQKSVSSFTIAQNAKKIIIASKDRKCGVYDIFSSELLSMFSLDGVVQSLDIREEVWLLAGCYQNQKSVNLWKIDNLDWKILDEIPLPFESELIKLNGDIRACYFGPDRLDEQRALEYQSKQI